MLLRATDSETPNLVHVASEFREIRQIAFAAAPNAPKAHEEHPEDGEPYLHLACMVDASRLPQATSGYCYSVG